MLELLQIDALEDSAHSAICAYEPGSGEIIAQLPQILGQICDYAYEHKILEESTVGYRDLFDTKVMSLLVDRPSKMCIRDRIYYEYQADGIASTDAIKGTYLDNYKAVWDLYINNATCEPSMIASMTGEDAAAEFALGEAVFYQNGTWAYGDITGNEVADEDLGMLPIYIGVEGEENQGLCTGSENYWCVNAKASEEDIQATLDFMNWVVTSDTGRASLANEMGFETPFTTFTDEYGAENPLLDAANEYIDAGKKSVAWCFTTMPSEEWKNGVGSALLEYAQGTGEWDGVVTAFVDGWASEVAATK